MTEKFMTFAENTTGYASEINEYLMRQTTIYCADATDRAAIPSPQEGMRIYRADLEMEQQYDGANWFTIAGKNPIACKATRSSTVSIPHAAETLVTWNSEEYDYATMHDNSTNANRITIPEDGIYLLQAHCRFASAVVASAIRFRKNGSTGLAFCYVPGSVTEVGDVTGTYVGKFTAGDYLETLVFQSNGSSAARNLNETTSFFSATKL